MKYIAAQSAPTDKDTRIFLTAKDQLDWIESDFGAGVLADVQQKIGQNANYILFPTANQLNIIELFEKNGYAGVEEARRAAAERIQLLRQLKVAAVFIKTRAGALQSQSYAEGLALANYQFLKYFNDKEKRASTLRSITIADSDATAQQMDYMNNAVAATCIARDLVNEPLSYLTATQLSEEIKRLAPEAGFEVTVFDKAKIEELKMGGLLAVNRGSFTPPTFSILEYKSDAARNSKPIVLVGKGVVYDTGGLSLKPTANSMDFMKSDMGGAAAVIGAIYAAAKSKLPLHIIGLVPATDNRPGNNAYAPGDVVEMHSGSTVEVLNTDAEGRMLLADALHYAKQYDPELVMDFATLTGAAARAVGYQGTCFMGNAETTIKAKFVAAGFATYERLVELPLWEEYGELLKSEIADVKNIGGAIAGAITAGKFLEHFTDYPWLHFDIAGAAFLHAPDHYRVKGGTGIGVRLLFEFLRNY